MAGFHNTVKLYGFDFPDSQFTFNLKDGITTADINKPVALDTSASNTVKLAGDGDEIIGKLLTVEDRVNEGSLVGAVTLRFASKFDITGTVVVGDTVVGGGSGTVKADADPVVGHPVVVDVVDTVAVVLKV